MRVNILKSLIKMVIICSAMVIIRPPGAISGDNVFAESGPNSPKDRSGFNLGVRLFSIYRNHISPVDADRCPSVPTCSSYAIQAIQKHGFFMGWMMTVDRLIHEGEEEKSVSPVVYSKGKWKIFDPVENNDFWWYTQDREDHE